MLHIVMVIRKEIQLWQENYSPNMEYKVSKGVMASVQAFYFFVSFYAVLSSLNIIIFMHFLTKPRGIPLW